ncbi:hypothetical protein CG710_017030 [Lachnotalea glycerini]|uniref:Uncharacterized protein n=1 Tax=Lachnotalea glycerini TaxID=1763509 RepID=A0A371JB59_9FIRM|nr:hypothetical protein CG710_017030 [Lachnotalea glycerini]
MKKILEEFKIKMDKKKMQRGSIYQMKGVFYAEISKSICSIFNIFPMCNIGILHCILFTPKV